MYNFLAESLNYKVYSMEDYVYLKNKSKCRDLSTHDKTDILIGWIYGNPTSALIVNAEKHVIVAGCGLLFFDIVNESETQLFTEPNNIIWTNALHQDDIDTNSEFRYVAYSEENAPKIFKMNILTKETISLS